MYIENNFKYYFLAIYYIMIDKYYKKYLKYKLKYINLIGDNIPKNLNIKQEGRGGPEEERWRFSGELLFHVRKRLIPVITAFCIVLHENILQKCRKSCKDCEHSRVEVPHRFELAQTFEIFKNNYLQHFAFHLISYISANNKVKKDYMNVVQIVDEHSLKTFLSQHSKIKINWEKSKSSMWFDPVQGPSEIAKLLVRPNDDKHFIEFYSRLNYDIPEVPEKIDDFEIHHFILIIMSNSIFLEKLSGFGPFRERTLQSLCWSFITWLKAYETRSIDEEKFTRIRSNLSNIIQEINLIEKYNKDLKCYFWELLRDGCF
jgi:hypothetical protein